jgi:DNA-binding MarR family transcriptional regulator
MTANPGHAADAVLAASRALLGMITRSLAPALEQVRIDDFRVLILHSSRAGIERRELAHRTGASLVSVEESLRRLSMAALLDVRDSSCALTPRGRALVDEVTERRRSEIARVLSRLDEPSRQRVLEGFRLFSQAIEEPPLEEPLIFGL